MSVCLSSIDWPSTIYFLWVEGKKLLTVPSEHIRNLKKNWEIIFFINKFLSKSSKRTNKKWYIKRLNVRIRVYCFINSIYRKETLSLRGAFGNHFRGDPWFWWAKFGPQTFQEKLGSIFGRRTENQVSFPLIVLLKLMEKFASDCACRFF